MENENLENKNMYVTYDDFKKMDIRLGTIKEIEPIPETDKLLRCQVDFGADLGVRQVVSGIRGYYPEYQELVGRQVLYIVNLEPRTIRGVESHGMLMAVGDNDCVFLKADKEVVAGSRVH